MVTCLTTISTTATLRFVILITFALGAVMSWPVPAMALLTQTKKDLRHAEDRISYESAKWQAKDILPILVATPQAHWDESRADFSPLTLEMLARVFPEKGSLIACTECLEKRVHVNNDNQMIMRSGELGLSDLARLRDNPSYRQARTVLLIRETPSGIAVRLTDIVDGRIYFSFLADASQTLDEVDVPLKFAREVERRQRGEALSYVFMDLGLRPEGLFQLKWLEQWGDRNQHMSGVALGLYHPTGALGATYHYMLPGRRRIMLALTVYYGLEGLFQSQENNRIGESLTGQAMLQYALSGSYGIFVSADSKGVISAGFSFLNPVFFPFLL